MSRREPSMAVLFKVCSMAVRAKGCLGGAMEMSPWRLLMMAANFWPNCCNSFSTSCKAATRVGLGTSAG